LLTKLDNRIELFKNSDQDSGNSRITISGFQIKITRDQPNETDYTKDLIWMKKVMNCVIDNLSISKVSGTIASSKSAIKLEGDGTVNDVTCRGNVITGCSIQDFPYGICLTGYCKRNMVDGNQVTSCSKGIYLDCAPSNIIMNNVASDATGHGIHLITSNLNSIVGNHASANGDYGIFLEQTLGCAVQGNVCYANKQDGIHLKGISTTQYEMAELNAITGNSCYDNDVTGINLEGYSKHNTMSGNVCANPVDNPVTNEIVEYGNNAESNLFVSNICHNGALTTNGTSITANNRTN
jgi:parallel beta-helix repeat protein